MQIRTLGGSDADRGGRADRASNSLLIATIQQFRPNDAFLSEDRSMIEHASMLTGCGSSARWTGPGSRRGSRWIRSARRLGHRQLAAMVLEAVVHCRPPAHPSIEERHAP